MSISRPIRISLGIVAGLVLLAGLSIWVWSFGAVASEGVPPMRIDVVKSPVSVKQQGETSFSPIASSVDVKVGDEVQTGPDGSASIVWGDRGITRLDPNTTVTIENAPEDPTAATHVVLKLHLESGRVWSRLLKLLDEDSAADVRTQSVVATVRGTSFGVEASSASTTDIAVTESVVGMSAIASPNATLVKEGFWGRFDGSGKVQQMRELLPTDGWAQDNIKADADFDEGLRRDVTARFEKRLVGGPSFVVNLSESMHLALERDPAQRDALVVGYMGRRIAEALQSPEKSDRILNHSLPLPWNKISSMSRERLLLDIRYALFTQTPRPGFTPNTTLIASLRGLRAELLGQDGKNQGYADALSIDDDIDTFLFSGNQKTPARRTELLGDIATLRDRAPQDATLQRKLDALNLRLQLTGNEESSDVPTSTDATTTSTREIPSATTPSGTKPTTATTTGSTKPTSPTDPIICSWQNLQLLAMPSAIEVGGTASLSLYANSSCNGSVQNLTSQATFTTDVPGLATINGSVLTAVKDGSVTVTGGFLQNGQLLAAKTTIRISPATKKPRSVSVTTSASTKLTTGQSAPLEAQVTYTDGSKTFVTPQCAWSTSASNVGIVQGTKFIATHDAGTASAICGYTENGITVSGSLLFTVSLDPALQPVIKKPPVGANGFTATH